MLTCQGTNLGPLAYKCTMSSSLKLAEHQTSPTWVRHRWLLSIKIHIKVKWIGGQHFLFVLTIKSDNMPYTCWHSHSLEEVSNVFFHESFINGHKFGHKSFQVVDGLLSKLKSMLEKSCRLHYFGFQFSITIIDQFLKQTLKSCKVKATSIGILFICLFLFFPVWIILKIEGLHGSAKTKATVMTVSRVTNCSSLHIFRNNCH